MSAKKWRDRRSPTLYRLFSHRSSM